MTREQIDKLQTYKLFSGDTELYLAKNDVLELLEPTPKDCDTCIHNKGELLECDMCGCKYETAPASYCKLEDCISRDYAIEVLKDWDGYFIGHSSDDVVKALNLAIKALEHPEKNVVAVVPCGDAISREEVLKLMKDNWHTHNGDWAMQESMDDIRALPSVAPQEPRWIPVSERLPEDSGEYLVSVTDKEDEEYKQVGVAWFAHPKDYDIKDGEWRELMIDEKVIAWMPLPEPFEPQESEV